MKIAILGMGTIGSGVYDMCRERKDIIVKRMLDIRVWMDGMTTDINDIVNDAEIETVVETMGGLHPAREFALACIQSGKNYVTANKHLVSEFGLELQKAAAEKGTAFFFSAACGGGIPYLRNLSEAVKIDDVLSLGGILNGTTNFILDSMQSEDMDYAEALLKAQQLGYAERDPSSDVDGLDTQRKLALACAVAFGKMPKASEIPTFGIRNILKMDIDRFTQNGQRVRLIAKADKTENGIAACVQPVVYSAGSPEAGIRKNINYAWYTGEKSGHFAYSGQGAGKYPTASNIIRDVLSIMRGEKGLLAESVEACKLAAGDAYSYYVRVPASVFPQFEKIAVNPENDGEWTVFTVRSMAAEEIKTILSCVQGAFYAALV